MNHVNDARKKIGRPFLHSNEKLHYNIAIKFHFHCLPLSTQIKFLVYIEAGGH